jgi:hypothetical protein
LRQREPATGPIAKVPSVLRPGDQLQAARASPFVKTRRCALVGGYIGVLCRAIPDVVAAHGFDDWIRQTAPPTFAPACRDLGHGSFNLQTRLDVCVCGIDQGTQACEVEVSARPHFHMTHTPTISYQQARGILQFCAKEESHVDVSSKDVDIAEWRISEASNGTSVMHQLSDIVAAFPHLNEPLVRNSA